MKYWTDLILGKAFCIFIFFHFPDSRLSVLKKVSILNFDSVTVKTTSNCEIFVSPEGPETSTPLFMNARLMWRASHEEKQTWGAAAELPLFKENSSRCKVPERLQALRNHYFKHWKEDLLVITENNSEPNQMLMVRVLGERVYVLIKMWRKSQNTWNLLMLIFSIVKTFSRTPFIEMDVLIESLQ